MIVGTPAFEKYVFVCERAREGEACCVPEGPRLRSLLKEEIKCLGLNRRVRVRASGCLHVCEQGPNVLIMPDNIWLKQVKEDDIPAMIDCIRDIL